MCSGGPPWESHSIPWLDSLSFFFKLSGCLSIGRSLRSDIWQKYALRDKSPGEYTAAHKI